MELIDKLKELATRIQRQKDSVLTEEAAKTAFVLPFLQALGYDVFNPMEVIPELTADHGVKKGEKVDYAIKLEDSIVMLIECKPVGANLEAKHAGQLFRYFSVTESHFGLLTDGVRYLFFSDLEQKNKMDDRPFFEFNLLDFTESHVEELKKFTKSAFNLETILGSASNLKYHKALMGEIRNEFDAPSDDLVRMLAGRVYSGGKITAAVRDQFTELTQRALRDFVRERINERLKTALDTDRHDTPSDVQPKIDVGAEQQASSDSGIETTQEELDAYRIIQAIGSEIVDPDRIVMRDAKSYCAILLDDNNRRSICRLHFGKTKMAIAIFTPNGEEKYEIERLSNIYQYRAQVHAAIQQYDS